MKLRKRLSAFAAFFLSAAMLLSITAYAAYYNTYTTVKTPIPNGNSCYATEGFAVGSTYVYSAKIKGDESKAVIYRTKMSDGTTTLMTNGDNGTTYCTYLGHANDMVPCTINGEYYLFVVTMKTDSYSLVKLRYSGTTYYKEGNYSIKYNGSDLQMTGVKITSKTDDTINFLFKNRPDCYRGSLPLTANSGTINVSYGFHIDTANALVNGSTIPDIASYTFQGFGYYNDTIYVPLSHENISVVLVYHNVSSASGTIYADSNLSFRITSSAYPYSFEIESCGIANGDKLYFNCNRKTDEDDADHDAVCYFNGYSAA